MIGMTSFNNLVSISRIKTIAKENRTASNLLILADREEYMF